MLGILQRYVNSIGGKGSVIYNPWMYLKLEVFKLSSAVFNVMNCNKAYLEVEKYIKLSSYMSVSRKSIE